MAAELATIPLPPPKRPRSRKTDALPTLAEQERRRQVTTLQQSGAAYLEALLEQVLGQKISRAAFQDYLDEILASCTDPRLRLLWTQLVLQHHGLALLQVQAAGETHPASAELLQRAVARRTREFTRLATALMQLPPAAEAVADDDRQPLRPRQERNQRRTRPHLSAGNEPRLLSEETPDA